MNIQLEKETPRYSLVALPYKYKHINSIKPCQMVIYTPKEGKKAWHSTVQLNDLENSTNTLALQQLDNFATAQILAHKAVQEAVHQ